MTKHKQHSSVSHTKPKEKASTESAEAGEEGCRCKEVSRKSPSGMIRLMMDDLAFWKKKRQATKK